MSKRSIESRTPSERMSQLRDMIRHAVKKGTDPNRVAYLRRELEELKAKQEALR